MAGKKEVARDLEIEDSPEFHALEGRGEKHEKNEGEESEKQYSDDDAQYAPDAP